MWLLGYYRFWHDNLRECSTCHKSMKIDIIRQPFSTYDPQGSNDMFVIISCPSQNNEIFHQSFHLVIINGLIRQHSFISRHIDMHKIKRVLKKEQYLY